MALAGGSDLAVVRSLGMLTNNPFIHHGTRGVGSLCSFILRSSKDRLSTIRAGKLPSPPPHYGKTCGQLGAGTCTRGTLLISNSAVPKYH